MCKAIKPRPFVVTVVRTVGDVSDERESRFSDVAEARITFAQAIREITLARTPTRYDITLVEEVPGRKPRPIASMTFGGVMEVSVGR